MSPATAFWDWMSAAPRHVRGTRALRAGLGLALLLSAATRAHWARLMWGPRGWSLSVEAASPRVSALAEVFSSDERVYLALALVGLAGFLLVCGLAPRLSALAGLIPFWMLHNRSDFFSDGGDNLIRLLLLYSLMLCDTRKERHAPLEVWVHNLGVLLILAQAMLIYWASGMAKARGRGWLDGTAVFTAAQDSLLFGGYLRDALRIPAVSFLATYGALLMEIWYPVAIFSSLRRPFLLGVVLFHLFTVIEMGLLTFGGTMIVMNCFVATDEELERLLGFGQRLLTSAQRRVLVLLPAVRHWSRRVSDGANSQR